ncbi:MAG: T9SS type A sorting domain-containing protein [Flavobacteriales bacterium]
MAVTDADAAYVYVINNSAAVYRSTNSAVSFTAMGNSTDIFGGLSWYGMGFSASNTNKDILFGGCFEFYKSTNGGATFTKAISCTWTGNTSTYIHADLHACESVGAFVFTGSDGGIHKGSNEGTSFVDLSTDLGIREFYCIGLSKSESGKIVGGAQDNGTAVFRTSDNKWYEFLGADGMETFVDWTNANNLIGTSQYGTIYISTNNGSNYSNKSKPGGIDGRWVTPIEQDPIDGTKMYVGNTGLYAGTIPTLSWTLVSNSPDGGKFSQIKIAPTYNNIFYVSTGANLYKSTNKGLNWTNIYNSISGTINNIAIDPDDENRVAIATTGSAKVYVTTNGGTNWTSKLLNLPSLAANCLVYKAGSENGLYVGMSNGVYYIDDNLANWQFFGDNLPNISVEEIEIDETGGYVYIGIYGRGAWKSPIYTTGPAAQKDVQALSINNYAVAGCGLNITPTITIKNKGEETLNSVKIEIYVNNALVSTIDKTGLSVVKGASTNVALGNLTGIEGANSIKVVLSNVNGGVDEVNTDNEITENATYQDGVSHTFYIDDNSKNPSLIWTIKQGNTTIKSSANITPTSSNGVTSYNFCLAQGCYDIVITDAFNSGSYNTTAWNSSTIYVGDASKGAGLGEVVSYNGRKYRAQWWTQGNAPGTNSVWLDLGVCVSSLPTDKLGLKDNENATTYFETTVANYTSPSTKQFCNGQTLTVDFSANNTNPNNCSNVVFTANITGGTGTTFAWNFGAGASPATANTAGPHTVQYTTTGSKDVTLTVDAITETKTAYVTVIQDPNLNASVDIQLTTGANPACNGDLLEFTSTPTNGGSTPTYKWYNGLNVVQTGNSNTYSTSSFNNNDEIRCELSSNLSCVASSPATSAPITIIVDVCTGIEGVLKNDVSIFPNPVLNHLTINNSANTLIQYRIYNHLGETLTMGTLNGTKKIDFSTYANGIYFVELNSGENRMIKQIVK